jgi:D-aminopeptidase
MRAEFRTVEEVDLAAQLENVDRLNGYTLEWTRSSFLAAHRAALSVFNMSIQGRRSGT